MATNIEFVINLLKHPTFLNDGYTTKFIDTTPELFAFKKRRDRATKILSYIADITVNGHPETAGRPKPPAEAKAPKPPRLLTDSPATGTRNLLEQKGPQAVADWMRAQKKVLVTDTTMRDGHQSLLATRMRSIDMIRVAPAYAANLPQLFSVECWGGATFDVAYRFLQECPWQRLRDLRAAMPNLMTQMLLRASNGVGYTNYPDNVVQAFVKQAALTGVDVFRVFDSLNWVENMRVAMDAVVEAGKVCEGTVCYTGDILNPDRSKYDLKYYVDRAKELKAAGAHVLGVKDMAGLLKPAAARMLIKALRQEVGLPIHFHTHDTSGAAAATILAACDAGVDAVDAAMDAFSGGTRSPASAPSSRRCATPTATPVWTSRRSGRSRTTGRACASNMPPSRRGCSPRPPRSTCTRCRAGSSPTSRRRRAAWGSRNAGPRWRRPMPMRTPCSATS